MWSCLFGGILPPLTSINRMVRSYFGLKCIFFIWSLPSPSLGQKKCGCMQLVARFTKVLTPRIRVLQFVVVLMLITSRSTAVANPLPQAPLSGCASYRSVQFLGTGYSPLHLNTLWFDLRYFCLGCGNSSLRVLPAVHSFSDSGSLVHSVLLLLLSSNYSLNTLELTPPKY